MPRPPLLYLAVGMKRTGKSKRTRDLLNQIVLAGRKVLLWDTQNEYTDIRTLPYDKVGLFTIHPEISMRRIVPFIMQTGEEMTPDEKVQVVLHILQYFRDGVLLLEDLNDYVYDYMPGDIIGKILGQRHRGLDVILHYHSLGAVQKKLWRHINVIRLHKCEDAVVDNRDKFSDKYELFKIAENIVNDQFYLGNKFFSVEILTNDRKITGEFSVQERDKAIEDYIRLHYSRLIRPHLQETNRAGKRQHTAASVYDAEMKRIQSTYFKI